MSKLFVFLVSLGLCSVGDEIGAAEQKKRLQEIKTQLNDSGDSYVAELVKDYFESITEDFEGARWMEITNRVVKNAPQAYIAYYKKNDSAVLYSIPRSLDVSKEDARRTFAMKNNSIRIILYENGNIVLATALERESDFEPFPLDLHKADYDNLVEHAWDLFDDVTESSKQ